MTNVLPIADRAYGLLIPNDAVFKSVSLLQAARIDAPDGESIIGRTIGKDRRRMMETLHAVGPEYFRAHPWPAIADHLGFKGEEMTPMDAAEWNILTVMSRADEAGIRLDDKLKRTVSVTARETMRMCNSDDDRLFFSAGINVLEAAITTGVNRVVAQREDNGRLGVVLRKDDFELLSETIRTAVLDLARKMGCADILSSEA